MSESRPVISPVVDSHAHLYFDRFDEDRDEMFARARAAGVRAVINVGIDLTTSAQALELARQQPRYCFASVGLHPTETEMSEPQLETLVGELRQLAESSPETVCAIGETGLDYYWDKATPAAQARAFRRQIELAESLDLPVIVHCRDALEDAIALVADYEGRVRGVFHCFAGTPAEAERLIALGWHISFAGNVTFPKAQALRESAAVVPLERLLLETDAPFLAPQAQRGQRNESSFVVATGTYLAELRGVPWPEFARHTTENTVSLFALKDCGLAG